MISADFDCWNMMQRHDTGASLMTNSYPSRFRCLNPWPDFPESTLELRITADWYFPHGRTRL
jgi:hypothetical protein